MGRINFFVPIRTDQHQVPKIRLGPKVFDSIERRRVEPLQVVEEECQGMVPLREHADESTEHQLEASSRVLEHEHSLRDELDPAWVIRSLALATRDGRAALRPRGSRWRTARSTRWHADGRR